MRPIPAKLCLSLLHEFEQGPGGGFAVHRYNDPVGKPTIGWGRLLSGIDDPYWDAKLSADQADALALADLDKAATGVNLGLQLVVGQLTDGQYAACIDFAFNEGVGRFLGSTFCHYIVVGNMDLAPKELAKWVYGHVNGQVVMLPGLKRRRDAELAVWNGAA